MDEIAARSRQKFRPQELVEALKASASTAHKGFTVTTADQRFGQTGQQALEVPLLCICQHHLGQEGEK